MKYNRLGQTGLYVSEICLGTMTFSGQGYFDGKIGSLNQQEATALIQRSLEAGVNFIDTADVYSIGESEKMTGQALKDLGTKRSDVVLATKVFGRMGPGPNDVGASRGHIMDAVSRSLERLQTDHIDLYQVHQTDLITPVEETLRALDDLVSQRMVRYIGCSNWEAWRLMKAMGISDKRGWARFETLQAYYSLGGRDLDRELVPLMRDQNIGCMVWSPLAGGYLAGKYSPGGEGGAEGRRAAFDFPPIDKARADEIVAAMRPIAAAHGVSVARVALAWVLSKPWVTTLIVGAKTIAQLDDNLEAATLKLTADELAALDAISAPPVQYPHWMVSRLDALRHPK
ncbi:MAG: aldo/keto reductase [Alphaproteobacteria bacterium]|jgi:aryl-alcohol dehydrogenase-like predicted oxidoreductase|nr:aldo/keto reductase [Alphaproteobacteria bacterium]